ncbi:hypothetical protein CSKR_203817 [Clonorchis sinensis]|uniref:Uncharacterized protein n=1 Tax=Clonorchis sinensis TaxID=79923 RepID=A0A8T1N2C4_CLOSI|nr:hypothetical protein CSKR_203817 [Clonorchis sinensis]
MAKYGYLLCSSQWRRSCLEYFHTHSTGRILLSRAWLVPPAHLLPETCGTDADLRSAEFFAHVLFVSGRMLTTPEGSSMQLAQDFFGKPCIHLRRLIFCKTKFLQKYSIFENSFKVNFHPATNN